VSRDVRVVRVELDPVDAAALAKLVADVGAAAGRPLGVTEAVRRLVRLTGEEREKVVRALGR
jgi:hypothetical protein